LEEVVEELLKKYEKEAGIFSKKKEIKLTADELGEFKSQLIEQIESEMEPIVKLAKINKWTADQVEKARQEERQYWEQKVQKLRGKLFELAEKNENLDWENHELKGTVKQLKQKLEDLQRKNEEINRLLRNLRSQLRRMGLDFDERGNLRKYEEPESPDYDFGPRL